MDPAVLTQLLLKFCDSMPLILLTIVRSLWFKGSLGKFLVNVFARLILGQDFYNITKNAELSAEDRAKENVPYYPQFPERDYTGWFFIGGLER